MNGPKPLPHSVLNAQREAYAKPKKAKKTKKPKAKKDEE